MYGVNPRNAQHSRQGVAMVIKRGLCMWVEGRDMCWPLSARPPDGVLPELRRRGRQAGPGLRNYSAGMKKHRDGALTQGKTWTQKRKMLTELEGKSLAQMGHL